MVEFSYFYELCGCKDLGESSIGSWMQTIYSEYSTFLGGFQPFLIFRRLVKHFHLLRRMAKPFRFLRRMVNTFHLIRVKMRSLNAQIYVSNKFILNSSNLIFKLEQWQVEVKSIERKVKRLKSRNIFGIFFIFRKWR